jgi:carbon monoxide dehydrogenase subunit G
MRVEKSIDLPASPDDVWDLVMDPRRLGDWVTVHRSAEADPDELRRGSSFKQTLALGGRPFTVTWTITEVERPRHASWEGSGPAGSRASVGYALERRNGGTRFHYLNDFKLPGGPLGAVAGKIIGRIAFEREAEKSLANLGRLFERPSV